MRRALFRTSAIALFAPVLLTGCVTAGDLNEEIAARSEDAGVAVPQDPCGGSAPSSFRPAASLAASNIHQLPIDAADGSDLAVGRALVRSATTVSARSAGQPYIATAGDQLGLFLGMDLAQFRDDDALVSTMGSELADRVAAGPIAGLQQQAAGAAAGGSDSLTISRVNWRASLQDLWDATSSNGWTSAFETALGRFYRSGATASLAGGSASPQHAALYADLVRKYLLAAYFKAYFRNGQILSITVSSDVLKQGLKERLKTSIKDDTLRKAVENDIDALSDDLVEALCRKQENCLALGVVGETTFVTRGGKSFGFPGISASFDPFAGKKVSTNKIDKDAVIGDLVRVFFEAGGDYLFQVPAVPKSTACDTAKVMCAAPGAAATVAKVDEIADRVEAAATAATGTAIRGGWLFALNNEALATALQTGVAVTLRKSAEKAAWSILSRQCTGVADTAAYRRIAVRLQ